jgi:hypothetical protein
MTTPTTPSLESFTPDDLRAAVILIDYACEQGAFKGWENINKAFLVRERINNFVEQWASISEPTPETIAEGNQ